jgi:hypothetical protein
MNDNLTAFERRTHFGYTGSAWVLTTPTGA